MLKERKLFITLFFIVSVTATIAAMNQYRERNLKVLPTDISDQKLDSIMRTYNTALGVTCKFCHAPFKNFPDSLDYASDTEPMKNNARRMMEMVIYLNKTYFNFDSTTPPEYLNTITCKTCHRGEPFPPGF